MTRRPSPCPCSGLGGDDQNGVRGSTRAVRSPRACRSLIALASLCLVLQGGLAYAETNTDQAGPAKNAERERIRLLLWEHTMAKARETPRGWCSSRRFHQDIIAETTRGDRGAGRIRAKEILAHRKFLQEAFADDDEGGLSAQEQFKVEFFMGGLAQSVRGLTANMLMGTEQNPASPLLITYQAHLARSTAWIAPWGACNGRRIGPNGLHEAMSVARIRFPCRCGAWNMRFVRNQESPCVQGHRAKPGKGALVAERDPRHGDVLPGSIQRL